MIKTTSRPSTHASLIAILAKADELNIGANHESAGEAARSSQSHRLFDALDKVSAERCKMEQLQLECDDRGWERKTADITRRAVLDQKKDMVDQLSSHIACIVQQRTEIASRLQQPFSGDSVPIELECHRNFKELIHTACVVTPAEEGEAAKWFQSLPPDVLDQNSKDRLQTIPGQLAELQRLSAAIYSVREASEELLNKESQLLR